MKPARSSATAFCRFSDHEAVAAALAGQSGMSAPLWTVDDDGARRCSAERAGMPAGRSSRHLDRQPHAGARAMRSSPSRATTATAMISSQAALKAGRRAGGRRDTRQRDRFAGRAAADRSRRARQRCAISRARRARACTREGHRRHRLGRQDQHQGGAAACALGRRRNPCFGRLLQQSLGRVRFRSRAVRRREVRRLRDRHEPCRRDHAADAARASARRASSRRSSRCILSTLVRWRRSPTRRRRFFRCRDRAVPSSLIATTRSMQRLATAARAAHIERIVSFGEHAAADARLIQFSLQADGSTVEARILGQDRHLQGRRAGPASRPQFARRPCSGLARWRGSRAGRARSQPTSKPASGRGARTTC